ncbi:ATP-binding protein [Flavobacterium sp.]|uniref:ATP-binding protein n=1 Tax=Flavobacterium sp. TaxID=239 RepID=UPI004048B246
MKKNYLLILFIPFLIYSQNEEYSRITDSLFEDYDESLYVIPLENSLKKCQFMLDESITEIDKARTYSCIGYVYNSLQQNDSAKKYYNKSFFISRKLKKPTIFISSVINYSNVALFSKDNNEYYSLVIEALKKVESLTEIKKKNHYKSKLYFIIAQLNALNDDLDKALLNYFKVIEFAHEDKKTLGYFGLGEIYYNKKIYDSSLKYYKKSLEEYNNFPNKDISQTIELNILTGIGLNYYEQKKLTDSKNILLNVCEKAENVFFPAKSVACIFLAKIYNSEKNYKKEIFYLNLAENSSLENEIDYHLEHIYLDKTFYFLKSNDYEKASDFLSKYILIKDSLHNLEKIKIEKNIYAKFKLDEMEKKNDLNELKIKNVIYEKKIIILYFISCIVIMLLGLIFFFYNNKTKKELLYNQEINFLIEKQKNEIVATKNQIKKEERERLANDLHDNIAGQLCAIKFSIDNPSLEKSFLMNKIDILYSEIRNFSHLLSEEIEKPYFSELLINFQDVLKKTGLQIVSNIDNLKEINNFDSYKTDSIYKIIQEIFSNILKHSKADKVIINIYLKDTNLYIKITDNGIGFNVKKIKNTFGIKNIKKRILVLNGILNIESNHLGTTIFITIPVNNLI